MSRVAAERHARQRIAFFALDFANWKLMARHVAYTSQMGLEEGFAAHGLRVTTITEPLFWKARDLLRGQRFDQVWIEVARVDDFETGWLEWITTLAPVRVGLMVESLCYTPEEIAVNPPVHSGMKERIEGRLKYMTHAVTVDEQDAAEINRQFMPALWWPQAVPARFVCHHPPPPKVQKAVFSGSMYGDRPGFVDAPVSQAVLVNQCSSERRTIYPYLFTGMHDVVRWHRERHLPVSALHWHLYMGALRWHRRICFARWLRSMQYGCAVVNLPACVKAYAGRVVEAMAAGRPAISWRIPKRPRTAALFGEDREILLFDRHQPEEMAEQARRVIGDEAFAAQLVTAARAKLLRYHTIEHRVGQILDWVANGTLPDYGENA